MIISAKCFHMRGGMLYCMTDFCTSEDERLSESGLHSELGLK